MKPKPLARVTYTVTAPITPRRIALVTDLHNGDPAPVCEALSEEKPDIICLVGDLFEGPPRRDDFAFDRAIECLRFCAGVAPCFYAPGNHDKTVPPEVLRVLAECRIPLLTDRCIAYGDLQIGGLTSAYYQDDPTPNLDFLRAFAARPGYKILLCHHPEYYRRYLKPNDLAAAFDLILSGHNHGGQWAIGRHGLYVPGQGLFPPHCAGMFDGRLIVSRGVYNNVRVPRIGTPPELVTVCLVRQ